MYSGQLNKTNLKKDWYVYSMSLARLDHTP